MSAVLYLLPNVLAEEVPFDQFFPKTVFEVVKTLDGVIAESERTARRYLAKISGQKPIKLLNEHTKPEELASLIEPLEQGQKWGILSDAGLPCIADPGSQLVALAHKKGILVQALVGPSSIVMALQLSGLSAQNFTFHGYLPRDKEERKKYVRALKNEARTHLFIEAPYRNQDLLQDLILVLDEKARLAVVWDLTTANERVVSKRVREWRQGPLPDLHKKPAIFLFSII